VLEWAEMIHLHGDGDDGLEEGELSSPGLHEHTLSTHRLSTATEHNITSPRREASSLPISAPAAGIKRIEGRGNDSGPSSHSKPSKLSKLTMKPSTTIQATQSVAAVTPSIPSTEPRYSSLQIQIQDIEWGYESRTTIMVSWRWSEWLLWLSLLLNSKLTIQ